MATHPGNLDGTEGSVEALRDSLGPDAARIWQSLQVAIHRIDGVTGSTVEMDLPGRRDLQEVLKTLVEYVRGNEITVNIPGWYRGSDGERVKESLREYAGQKGLRVVDLGLVKMFFGESFEAVSGFDDYEVDLLYRFVENLHWHFLDLPSDSPLLKFEVASLRGKPLDQQMTTLVRSVIFRDGSKEEAEVTIPRFRRAAFLGGLNITEEFLPAFSEALAYMFSGSNFEVSLDEAGTLVVKKSPKVQV